MSNFPCNKAPVKWISCCDVMDCIDIQSSDNSVTVTKSECGVDITQTGNNLDQILALEDADCITWVKEFLDGVLTYTPQLNVDCVVEQLDIEDFININNGTCITWTKTVDVDGITQYTPVLDMACILAALVEEDLCDACQDPVIPLPEVTLDCEGVEVFGTFELGTPSVGFITIPVTVVGSGLINAEITTLNGSLFGSTAQYVNGATTSLSVPLYYNGGGSDGAISITITINGVDVTIECDTDVTVDPGGDCVDVTIADVSIPDAAQDVAYSYSIPLSGTAPFAIDTIVKPAWMTVALVGSNVELSGTPDSGDLGTDIVVSFNITNCVSGTDSFSDTFDVTAEPEFKYYNADMYACSSCGGGPVEEDVPVKIPIADTIDLGKFYIGLVGSSPDVVFIVGDPTEIAPFPGAIELSSTNFTLCTSACSAMLPPALLRVATTTEDACENTGDAAGAGHVFCVGGVLANGVVVYEDQAGQNPFEGNPGKKYVDENNCKHGTIAIDGTFTQEGTCGGSGFACA